MTETLRLINGLLYRGDHRLVTVVAEHDAVRRAYLEAQQRWNKQGGAGWLPDGGYEFDGQMMKAATDD